MSSIFHLAFPVKDIDSTIQFYQKELGFKIDLIEKKRCIIDLKGNQLVAHVSEGDIPERVSMYPRHFGIIYDDLGEFEALLEKSQKQGLNFFQELMHRFEGYPREHKTFFVIDPSNNLLEFKWYKNKEYILKGEESTPTLEEFMKKDDDEA